MLRRSAASPSRNTDATTTKNGAVFCRRIAFAAAPRAIAEMNIAFMTANVATMTGMSGRKRMSRGRNIGNRNRPAKSAR